MFYSFSRLVISAAVTDIWNCEPISIMVQLQRRCNWPKSSVRLITMCNLYTLAFHINGVSPHENCEIFEIAVSKQFFIEHWQTQFFDACTKKTVTRWMSLNKLVLYQGCSQDQQWQDQDQVQDLSSQDPRPRPKCSHFWWTSTVIIMIINIMFKSKTTQRNIIIIITMFVSKLFHKHSFHTNIIVLVMCTSQTTLQTIAIVLCLWLNRKTTQWIELSQWMSQMTPMCLQSSIAFRNHQVTQYIISHACPVKTHEDATMAKDSLLWGGGC